MAEGFEIHKSDNSYATGELKKYPGTRLPLNSTCRSNWRILTPEETIRELTAEVCDDEPKPTNIDIHQVARRFGLNPDGYSPEETLSSALYILHRHLGHPSFNRFALSLPLYDLGGVKEDLIERLYSKCRVCLDKPRPNRPITYGDSTKYDGLIEQDVTFFPITGIMGATCISVIYDMNHKLIDAEALKSKNEASTHTARYLSSKTHVKVLRVDNAPELTGKQVNTVLRKHGVALQTTAPGNSFSNGGVERANRTLKDRIHALMVDLGIDTWPELWPWMVHAAAKAHNATFNPSIGTSPERQEKEHQADEFYFGQGVLFTNPVEKRKKNKLHNKLAGIFIAKQHDGACEVLEPVAEEDCLSLHVVHPTKITRTSNEKQHELLELVRKIAKSDGQRQKTKANTTKTARVLRTFAYTLEGTRYVVISRPQKGLAVTVPETDGGGPPRVRAIPSGSQKEPVLVAEQDQETYQVFRVSKGHYLQGYGYVAEDEVDPMEVELGHFKDADNKEWSSILENDVLGELMAGPEACSHPPIRTRFRRIRKANGTPKTRFIVCATHDKRMVETTTHPPGGYARRLAHIAGLSQGWNAATVDVRTAFLLVPVADEIFIRLPDTLPEVAIKHGHVPRGIYKLKRSLYGLKESPKLFEEYLQRKLESIAFERIDDGVFLRKEPRALLVTYVDDVLCWSPDPMATLNELTNLVPCAEIQPLGTTSIRYIGEDLVMPEQGTVITSLESYIRSLPENFPELTAGLPRNYTTQKLSPMMLPLSEDDSTFESLTPTERNNVQDRFRTLVGTLGWAAMSHPAFAYRFGQLARSSASPSPTALRIAVGAWKELIQNCTLSLRLTSVKAPQLRLWVDAAIRDMNSRRGWLLQMVDTGSPLTTKENIIAWRSVKDDLLHHSSVSAEVNAIYQALIDVRDVLFSVKAIFGTMFPICLLTDSLSGRTQILNQTGSKDERGRGNYIRSWMADMKMTQADFLHIPGEINLADPLTKPTNLRVYNTPDDLT